jgi:hypothetical protein
MPRAALYRNQAIPSNFQINPSEYLGRHRPHDARSPDRNLFAHLHASVSFNLRDNVVPLAHFAPAVPSRTTPHLTSPTSTARQEQHPEATHSAPT